MVAAFNFSGIRNTAITNIKKFGRPMSLLRSTEGTAADASKPWRVGAGSVTAFSFRGVYSPLGFPKTRDPAMDSSECDVLVPGDITVDSVGNVVAAVEPLETDRVQIFGVIAGQTDPVFGIIGVQRIDPDGNQICFKLRCRAWPLLTQPGASGV